MILDGVAFKSATVVFLLLLACDRFTRSEFLLPFLLFLNDRAISPGHVQVKQIWHLDVWTFICVFLTTDIPIDTLKHLVS